MTLQLNGGDKLNFYTDDAGWMGVASVILTKKRWRKEKKRERWKDGFALIDSAVD
jgi:hypothetical protein